MGEWKAQISLRVRPNWTVDFKLTSCNGVRNLLPFMPSYGHLAIRCANTCPKMRVIGSDEGPAGGKSLTKTTFVQRLNTKGGSAPANPVTGCLVSTDVGHHVLVPYSADYFFLRNDQ